MKTFLAFTALPIYVALASIVFLFGFCKNVSASSIFPHSSSTVRSDHYRVLQGSTVIQTDKWTQLGDDLEGEVLGEFFGYDAATSRDGTFIIVGSPRSDDNGTNSGKVRVYKYNEGNNKWDQVGDSIIGEKRDDGFGWSVDMNNDGNIVVIGAYANDENGSNAGHARVYRFINGQWVKQGQDLNGNDEGDWFGFSVAISGDGERVVIGGPQTGIVTVPNPPSGTYPGYTKVYEFNKASERWNQMGNDIIGEGYQDLAGSSVDINKAGDMVIIGAIYNSDGSPKGNGTSGHARIYRYTNGQWMKQGQDLDGETMRETLTEYFGHSVAISDNGDRIIIGGPSYGVNYSGRAKIYEFNRDKELWEQIGEDISGVNDEDMYGHSVDMNGAGDVVVIGAPTNDGTGNSLSGHVRVYQLLDGQWIQQGQVLDGEGGNDLFGNSVAISGDANRVIIGGPWNDGENGFNTGHVRVFEFSTAFETPTEPPSMEPSKATKAPKATKGSKVTKGSKSTRGSKVTKMPKALKSPKSSKTSKDGKVNKLPKTPKSPKGQRAYKY